MISTSGIKRCNNVYLSFYHRWWSSKVNNTELSYMPFYKSSADTASTLVWPILSKIFTVKSYSILHYRAAISGLYSQYVSYHFSAISRRLSKCYSIHNKGQSWKTNDPFLRNYWYLEWLIPWSNNWPLIKYFMTKCGFRQVHHWVKFSEQKNGV